MMKQLMLTQNVSDLFHFASLSFWLFHYNVGIFNQPVLGFVSCCAMTGGIKDQCEEIAGELVDVDANSAYDSCKVAVSSPMGVIQEDGAVNERCNLDVPVLSSSSNCEVFVFVVLVYLDLQSLF